MAEEKLEVKCTKCGNVLKFSPKFVGRTGMCPACGSTFKIAAPEAPATPELPRQVGHVSGQTKFKISTYFDSKKPPKKP